MNLPASQPSGAQAPVAYNPFVDPAGLGVRTIGCDTFSGELLEVLRLTPDLGTPGDIEPLVRERCSRFEPEPPAGLAHVVRIERTFDGRLEAWSRMAEGFRLSAVLEWAETRDAGPSMSAALTIGDRLLAAIMSLQAVEQVEGASGHGAIAVDQIVVSDAGALTVTDYAFGTTLAALQWPRDRMWARFRIALPPAAGLMRFDHRVDVTQAAVVIASLLAGRVFKADEYPRRLDAMVAEAVRRSGAGVELEDRNRLSSWLRAATELEPRTVFRSAAAARQALRETLGHFLDDTDGINRWLCTARGMPEPAPSPRAVEVPPVEAPQPAAPVSPAPIVPQAAAPPSTDDAQARPAGAGRLKQWLSRS